MVYLLIRSNFVDEINSLSCVNFKKARWICDRIFFLHYKAFNKRGGGPYVVLGSCGHTTKWRAPWRQLGKEILKFVKIKIMCFVIAEKSTSPSQCSPTPIIPPTTLLHPAPHLLCLSQTPTPPLPTTETTSSQSCFTPTIWRSSYTEGCTFMLFWMADKIIVHSYIPRHASAWDFPD